MNLKNFQEQFLNFMSENPNICLFFGLEKNLGELPDPGKNKRINEQGKIKMLLKSLDQISVVELNESEKIDHKLCKKYLENWLQSYDIEIDGIPMDYRMPRAAREIIGPIFTLFINDPRPESLRLVNIVTRLEKTNEFLKSYCRNLNKPVKRWVDMELQSLAGASSLFDNVFDWAKEFNFKNLDRLEKAIASANVALKSYEDFLNNIETSKSIFIGLEQTKKVVEGRGINLSLEQIHQIAKDFIAKNQADIKELKGRLIAKYDLEADASEEDVQKFIAKKFKVERSTDDFSYILDRYQTENKEIMDFIKERDLFPVPENQNMMIIQTPKFFEPTIPAGAMMSPAPLREGTKQSIIYLTLSEQLLDEHTEISIPAMMIHEGIPGHHLQFVHAQNSESLIRKIYHSNDLSEGWTTMLEDYMLDLGYKPEFKDEIRFCTKRDLARLGARVAIDLYFMSGDKQYLDIGVPGSYDSEDPFINAGELLKKVSGFVDARVQGELNWYSQERGYPLSYLVGNHLTWRLKDKFKEKYKNKFSGIELDREFHKQFLAAGNMPLSILEEVLL